MLILSIVPEWVIHLVFVLGLLGTLVGFLLGFLPFIKQYALPIRLISLVLFTVGVFIEGALSDYKEWELKIKEAEIKVAKAEAKSAELNTKLQSAILEKEAALKNKGQTIVKYIDKYRDREVLKTLEGPERVRVEEVIKYIENCPVPKELIDIHNKAAKMNEGDKK